MKYRHSIPEAQVLCLASIQNGLKSALLWDPEVTQTRTQTADKLQHTEFLALWAFHLVKEERQPFQMNLQQRKQEHTQRRKDSLFLEWRWGK